MGFPSPPRDWGWAENSLPSQYAGLHQGQPNNGPLGRSTTKKQCIFFLFLSNHNCVANVDCEYPTIGCLKLGVSSFKWYQAWTFRATLVPPATGGKTV